MMILTNKENKETLVQTGQVPWVPWARAAPPFSDPKNVWRLQDGAPKITKLPQKMA